MLKFIFLTILFFVIINAYSFVEKQIDKQIKKRTPFSDKLIETGFGKIFSSYIRGKTEDEIKKDIEEYVSDYHNHLLKINISDKPIKQSSKAIMLVIGDNGVGKTTTCLKLANFYNDCHTVTLATSDTFKKSYEEFYNKCKFIGVDFIKVPEDCIKTKSCINYYIDKFINDSESLLVIDTSGRNMNKTNLRTEIINAVSYLKNIKNKIHVDIFVINAIRANTKCSYDISDICDYVIINHVNSEKLTDGIFKLLDNYYKKILIINYTNDLHSVCFIDLNYVIDKLSKRIFNMIKNYEEK